MKHLTVAELTDLIWTAVDGLGSASSFRVQAAADMLLLAIQEHGAELETVRGPGHPLRVGRDGSGGRGTPGSQHLKPASLGQGSVPELSPDGGATDPTLTSSTE